MNKNQITNNLNNNSVIATSVDLTRSIYSADRLWLRENKKILFIQAFGTTFAIFY